jgi:4'-phosphopantetheinyl transferase
LSARPGQGAPGGADPPARAGAAGRERLDAIAGVELWRIALDLPPAELAVAAATLAPDERERAARLARPALRDRFVAARGGVRAILAGYVGAPPGSLELVAAPGGKPALRGGPRFSVSHSDAIAVLAVSGDREVGVDVEALRPVRDPDALARRWLPADELEAYLAARGDVPGEAFLRLWTRREAYLKALGVGISGPEIHASIDPARWDVYRVHPAEGYVGTLVVERGSGR